MKWIIAFLCVVLTTVSIAQKPEPVYGFAKDQREESWYQTQLQLWKAEVGKDKTNGDAWYYYYRSARALRNLSHGNEAKFKEYQELCAKISEDAYAANPDSFEGNYLKWAEGGNTLELFPFLKKAYEIDPLDYRTYEDLATYYEIVHSKKEYENACQLMYTANTMNAGMINWGYNMLAEVDQNAVILTAGDNDTYSAWVVQEARNFRKDVKVINLSLIMIDDYRNQLLKELKLPALDLKANLDSQDAWEAGRDKIIAHFMANSQTRPVYVAVSAIQSVGDNWSDHLYLTGLTYKYAKEDFDNTSIIIRNYEHRYLMDYLKMTFFFSIGEKMVDHLNGCYLPSMLKLYQHYKDSEQTTKMKETEQLLIAIGKKAGQEDEVSAILGSNPGKSK
jgi:hypothetical protein